MKNKFLLLFLFGLIFSPKESYAQAITSYEVKIYLQSSGSSSVPVRTLTVPATNFVCSAGTSSANTTTWLAPTNPFKVQFKVGANLCTFTAPLSETTSLSPGLLHIATISAINEVGMKGDPSADSNPFGLASKPAILLELRVISG